MTTKRFILMLLVMLGSVTGAWAQEPTKLHLTYVEDDGGGAIPEPENAFDGDLTTRTNFNFRGFDSSNPYITFKTDFPVRVDQLSIHYVDDSRYITGFELKGLKNEGGDWDTQSTSMLHETNLGEPTEYVFGPGIPKDFVHGPLNITCNPEDRYQYFRIYFNSATEDRVKITEIELYVTCDHSYPAGTNVCSKCGYKDESVLHEHVYSSDWSYDKDGHWQACSGTVGICNSPRGNYASHSSGLTCSVCGMPHCHQLDDAGSCRVDGCGYSVSSISQDLFEALETYGGSSSSSFNNLGNLFDGNTDTKWQAGATATAIFKTQVPVRIDGYSFHSVDDDYYHPHPKSWTLYGYDETANTWQIVHSVIDASPSNGWNNYRFINNDGPLYSYFKLEITKLQKDHLACNTNIGGLALDIRPVADHTHISSSEWYSDNFGHWHKCVGEGICNEPKRDYAVHQINGGLSCICGLQHSHQLNNANGKCSVSGCNYILGDVPSGFISSVNEYGGSTSTGASVGNLFDENTDTKWRSGLKGTAIFKTQVPVRINGYSYHSETDYYLPHPKSWTLYGYDETASAWQIIHSVIDASPSNGWNNYRFLNNNGPLYSYYKLEITKLQNDHPNSNTNIGGLTLDIIHEHHYVVTYVSKDEHVLTCTSEVGKCTVPEIRVGHTLEVVDGTYVCGLCGWRHEHNYTAKQDDAKHWTECDGEGECNVRTKDEAEHNIHESILCDTENYMCDVCQYVDEEKKAQFGADRDYLSMTAVGGDVRIGFKKVGSPASYTIQVSEDGNIWSERQTLTESTTTPLATIPEGKTYYFRHGSTTAIGGISTNQNNHWSFTMTGDGTIEADGNIISLIDATCQKNSLAGSPQHVFTALFKGCERLTVAPALPFPATGEFNYMYMFEGTGISVAPQLPATTAVAGAYMGMFKDCKKLETVPILPATTVGRRGYEEMFYGCEKLKTVEIANITTVTSSADGAFTNWLTGTAADTDGKLTAPLDGICNTMIPAECIPSNWQWATKLKANEDPDNDGNFYTTFFDSRYDYKVEDGFKAYSGIITTTEGDERELRLKATPNNIIPKDDGVIIHGGSDEVLLTVSDGSATKVAGNVLTGSDTDTTAPDFCYILSYGQQRLGFYKYEKGKALSAHKGYLIYERPAGAPAKAFRMVFVDEETGIDNVNVNDNDGSTSSPTGIYSVSGVRLNKLQKGINIVNGKKIVVK